MSEVKSGTEIVNSFFDELLENQELDKDVVKVLIDLHKQSKLTSTNIANQLEQVRKKVQNDKTE